MKFGCIVLACLLLLTPYIMLSSAQTSLSIEWQRNIGFDLHNGINGQYTIIAHPLGNTTTRVEFFLDGKLQLTDTQAPFFWTFNTDNYPEGQHTIQVNAYTSAGETQTATEQRSFTGFPYMFIVGVLLFASIVFAFVLMLTWHFIKKKAKARIAAKKSAAPPQNQATLNKFFIRPQYKNALKRRSNRKWQIKYKTSRQQPTRYRSLAEYSVSYWAYYG